MPLLRVDANGLWCEAGGFHIDPWAPVPRALITHGHSDHARPDSAAYLCADSCAPVIRERLGVEPETLPYGATRTIGEVTVSFHPAGHVLGSAQIRVEHRGEVWVASGDYKLAHDKTCTPFEPVPCNTFITESTFGLPIYRWGESQQVFDSINDWWRGNKERGKCSVIFAYALGKSQRLLTSIDTSIGPVCCHGGVERMNRVYRESGVALPDTTWPKDFKGALVIAPPSAMGTPWLKRFGATSTAIASGWMRIRGKRRHRSIERGFVLSDHADWPGLQQAISATGAETVLVTHGYRAPMVRWLQEQGKQAESLETHFEAAGEAADEAMGEAVGEAIAEDAE